MEVKNIFRMSGIQIFLNYVQWMQFQILYLNSLNFEKAPTNSVEPRISDSNKWIFHVFVFLGQQWNLQTRLVFQVPFL